MNTIATHTAPTAWSGILVEQFRLLGLRNRRELGLLSIVWVTLAILLVREERAGGEILRISVLEWGLMGVIGGILLPLVVWRSQPPVRRAYFLSLPVDRTRHQLAKAAAGWLWLMILVILSCAGLLAVSAATGAETVPRPPWVWVAPLAGATAAYLLGTAVALLSPWPLLFYVAVVAGTGLYTNLIESGFQLPSLEPLFAALLQGRLGFGRVAVGGTIEPGPLAQGDLLVVPDGPGWLLATAFWLTLLSIAVVLAARRHRDA